MKLQNQEVFLFAAKIGSLEGHLYHRRKVEPLANWVDNISRMYRNLSPEVKEELAPVLIPILIRAMEYGRRVLEPENREKLQEMLNEASAIL